jgi:hypothetical protein
MLVKEDSFQNVRLHILTLPKAKERRKTFSHLKFYKFYNLNKVKLKTRVAMNPRRDPALDVRSGFLAANVRTMVNRAVQLRFLFLISVLEAVQNNFSDGG